MARRFLPVILPQRSSSQARRCSGRPWRDSSRTARVAGRAVSVLGIVMVTAAGWHFFGQTQPILPHVEYAGVVTRLERLAARIGDDDVVIMESRERPIFTSRLPLAYVYARNVLVLRVGPAACGGVR